MVFRVADNTTPTSWASRFRQRRMALLRQLAGDQPLTILDVGGSQEFWACHQAPSTWRIITLNLSGTSTVHGDATALPFQDHSVDVVFSNSVIEHVLDAAAMAREVRRVGRRVFIQTPNRYFPLEAHALLPLFQFWPRWLQIWALRHRALGAR